LCLENVFVDGREREEQPQTRWCSGFQRLADNLRTTINCTDWSSYSSRWEVIMNNVLVIIRKLSLPVPRYCPDIHLENLRKPRREFINLCYVPLTIYRMWYKVSNSLAPWKQLTVPISIYQSLSQYFSDWQWFQKYAQCIHYISSLCQITGRGWSDWFIAYVYSIYM
jgi:hypothetical protein